MNRAETCLRCRRLLHSVPRSLSRRAFTDAKSRPPSAPKPIIDIKHIRQHPALYEQACRERNYPSQAANPAQIVELHERWQALQREGRALRERANLLRKFLANPATSSGDDTAQVRSASREEVQCEARQLKAQLAGIEEREAEAVARMEALTLALPNLTSEETPRGDEPVTLRYIHKMTPASRAPDDRVWRSHVHVGSELGILDFAGAANTSGWGWYNLLGEAAQLEHALVQHALDTAIRWGWTPVSPPSVIYSHIGAACGYQPRDQHGEQQVYNLAQAAEDADRGVPPLSLAGTAEIPLAGMEANTVLDAEDLPLKRVAASRCYRAEAGARGADTKGLYRVHEFTKVELFAWTPPTSAARHVFDEMLELQREILEPLGLPCRLQAMPARELGASATRKVDVEAFFPSRASLAGGGWGELASASLCGDYQARRLATRTRLDDGRMVFPFSANATALAVPRVLAAILEHGWDETTRTVRVPPCLRGRMGDEFFIRGRKRGTRGADRRGPPSPT